MAKFFLVGAGPGDPELLTVAAYKAILSADLVLYDRLVSKEILALVPRGAHKRYVGKEEGQQDIGQLVIFEEFLRLASLSPSAGSCTVVRLKGGDPLIFGRGGEEWLFLKELGQEVHYIPGISSATALPGLAGIPLTMRGASQSFAVVTGHCAEPESSIIKERSSQPEDPRLDCRNAPMALGLLESKQPSSRSSKAIYSSAECQSGRIDFGSIDWSKYLGIDTLVILMGVRQRSQIAQELIRRGRRREEPAAFISSGSLPTQKVVTTNLLAVAEGRVDISPPAIFVIGEVVKYSAILGGEFLSGNFGAEISKKTRDNLPVRSQLSDEVQETAAVASCHNR